MGRLEELLKSGQMVVLSGPYGTEVTRRLAEDISRNQQKLADVPFNRLLGPDGSALLTDEGKVYLHSIANDYANSAPPEQPLIMMTPSFRLSHKFLYAASTSRVFDSSLPTRGLQLCQDATEICLDAIKSAGRDYKTTLVAISIWPPFECYAGEKTPRDVDALYLPQVLAIVRFGSMVDYLLFETVPSLRAAKGVARAFKQSHEEIDTNGNTENLHRIETIAYLGDILSDISRNRRRFDDVPHNYNPKKKAFLPIIPAKDYVISFCLEEDATLNGVELNKAINELYQSIEKEKLYKPLGLGINCNSVEVTLEALSSLSPENVQRLVSIHPNASPERNPRKYGLMTENRAIPLGLYVSAVDDMVKRFDLRIYGGCCATDHKTMKGLIESIGK